MIETLMTRYIIALIYRDTRANCVEVAECFEGLSHDPFSRMLGEVRCWPTRLWQDFARRLIGEGGYLLLDDTVRNGGQAMFGVHGVSSSRLGKVVRRINLVLPLLERWAAAGFPLG
ncbi:MAG: hypothetical protein NZ823_00755 [Blastocatellia bacterium]|nr:hypothetical protein [Blastocatellia bacterium]